MARAMTPLGSSISSPAMHFSRPWMRAMPSPTARTVPVSETSTPAVNPPSCSRMTFVISSARISMASLHSLSSPAPHFRFPVLPRPRFRPLPAASAGAPRAAPSTVPSRVRPPRLTRRPPSTDRVDLRGQLHGLARGLFERLAEAPASAERRAPPPRPPPPPRPRAPRSRPGRRPRRWRAGGGRGRDPRGAATSRRHRLRGLRPHRRHHLLARGSGHSGMGQRLHQLGVLPRAAPSSARGPRAPPPAPRPGLPAPPWTTSRRARA